MCLWWLQSTTLVKGTALHQLLFCTYLTCSKKILTKKTIFQGVTLSFKHLDSPKIILFESFFLINICSKSHPGDLIGNWKKIWTPLFLSLSASLILHCTPNLIYKVGKLQNHTVNWLASLIEAILFAVWRICCLFPIVSMLKAMVAEMIWRLNSVARRSPIFFWKLCYVLGYVQLF